MKVKKYLLAGVLTLSLSAPVFGQEVSYQEALKPIAAALNADPNNPKAAKDLVKDYLKEYKKDADAIVGLGTIYLQVHNFEKAQEMADLVLANKKMNQSNAYMLLGDIAALQDSVGNAGAAATQYQTAISIDPQNVLAYERYACVYRHVSPETAVKKLEELRQVKPDYPVEVKAAEIMLADQKYAEAAKWFAKAPKTQLDETAYYQYIVAEFYSGNAKNALEVARHGLQKYAGSEYLSRLAVMAAVDQNQFPEALTYSENVMRGKEQKNYNDYYYYGQALAGNDKFQEAINAYNKCLELSRVRLIRSASCLPLTLVWATVTRPWISSVSTWRRAPISPLPTGLISLASISRWVIRLTASTTPRLLAIIRRPWMSMRR